MSQAMFFAPAFLAVAPLAGIASSPLGVDGAKTVQHRDVLREVYQSQHPCSNVRDALMDLVREAGGRPVFIRRESPATTTWSKRDSAYFREIADCGIPTVLIVEFWGHTLEGPEGSNPRLTIDTRLDGWVMDTHTRKPIGTATVTHSSQRKERYASSAEASGIAFKETMAEAGQQAAGELISELRP